MDLLEGVITNKRGTQQVPLQSLQPYKYIINERGRHVASTDADNSYSKKEEGFFFGAILPGKSSQAHNEEPCGELV